MENWIIFGCGDMGRQVAALLKRQDPTWPLTFATEVLSDPRTVHGIPVLKSPMELPLSAYSFTIAIQDSKARERIVELLDKDGLPMRVISDHAIVYPTAKIGEGCIIGDFNIIHPDATLGRHCHVNSFSYVGVDAVLGDFVTLTHHIGIGRGVVIEDHVFIGQGVTIFPGVRIGRGAKLGMGATILADVLPNFTVTGIYKGKLT